MRPLNPFRFAKDRRGVAATEFALIAPALIFLVMGVLEMSMRFRANEDATRYTHQVADLISREDALTTDDLDSIYDAAVYMMRPLDTTSKLDLDVSSIQFQTAQLTPTIVWRRRAGPEVAFNTAETAGMGAQNETVIRIGVRYRYSSIITDMFGGGTLDITRSAFARPRQERIITIDGVQTDNNGQARTFGS